jgi:hypothetical protein
MWLNVIPYAPSLRLADQWFQVAGSVRSGVQSFSSFGTCWTCTCGHTDDNNDDAHALGCNQLSSPFQSCHERAAEVLREFIAWASAQATRGDNPRLRPAPLIVPKYFGAFNATYALDVATFSEISRSSIPWFFGAFVSPLGPLAMPLLFRMPTSVLAIFCPARCD